MLCVLNYLFLFDILAKEKVTFDQISNAKKKKKNNETKREEKKM